MIRRTLVAVWLSVALALAPAGLAGAEGESGQPSNAAIAVNTKDGSTLFDLAFQVRTIVGEVASPENIAVAYASCVDCTTVAIAVQVVFVVGQPSEFTPQNLALAINESCTGCTTFASAYQLVVPVAGRVRISGDGRQRLNELRKAIVALEGANLAPAALDAELDRIIAELGSVLSTELRVIDDDTDAQNDADENGSADDSSTSTTTTSPRADDEGTTTTTVRSSTSTTTARTSSTTSNSSPSTTATTAP